MKTIYCEDFNDFLKSCAPASFDEATCNHSVFIADVAGIEVFIREYLAEYGAELYLCDYMMGRNCPYLGAVGFNEFRTFDFNRAKLEQIINDLKPIIEKKLEFYADISCY